MFARSLPAFVSILAFLFATVTTTADAQKTWDGGGDGTSWTDGNNWDPNGVPGPGDNVVLTGSGTIQLGAGTITIASLDLTSKTLEGTANLTISGAFTWNSGQLLTSGTTNVGGLTTVDGSSSHIIANGTLNLNGGGTWADGNLNLGAASVVNVPGGQTLTVTDTGTGSVSRYSIGVGQTEPQFNLTGALTKAGGSTGITSIDVELTVASTGSINVPVGFVDLGWSSEIAGTLNPTSSGIIEIDASSGGFHNFNTGSTVTGDGTFQIASGTTNFNDTHAIASTLAITGGTVNILGTVNANGVFNWSNGTLANTGTFNTNGTVSFLTGSNKIVDGPTFNLASAGTMEDGYIYLGGASVFNLQSLQTLTITDSGANGFLRYSIQTGETEPVLNVGGALTKAGGSTGITSIDVELTVASTGSINVPAGFVDLGRSSEITGTLNPTGSGVIEIDASSGGAHNFNAGSAMTGDGTFQISSGTTNFNDTHAIAPTFSFTNGTVNILGTVNANGVFNWSTGTLANTGTFNANGTVSFLTGSNKIVEGPTFNMASAGTVEDGYIYLGAGAVFNLPTLQTLTITDSGPNGFLRYSIQTGETEPVLNLIGTLTKGIGSTGITSIDVVTSLSGDVNVPAGFVDLGWSSEITGTLNPTGSGIVEIDASSGGVHNFNAGSAVTGNGTFQISSGTTNFNDTHAIAPTFSFTNGTVNVLGTINSNGVFNWSNGTLANTGTFNANGTVSFLTGSNKIVEGATFNMASAGTLADGYIYLGGGSVFNLPTLQTLTITDPGPNGFLRYSIQTGETEPILNLIGTLTKAGGSTGITSIDVEIELPGTINAPVGSVDLGWSSEITGTLNPTGSGIIEIDASSGGVHNFNAGSAVTGNGTFQISSGTTNFNDTHAIAPTFSFTNGAVNLFGTVNANGVFNWSNGTLANTGTINANGTVSFLTGSNKIVEGATFNMASAGTVEDGYIYLGGGSVFNLQNLQTLTIADSGPNGFLRYSIQTGETEPVLNLIGTLTKGGVSTGVTTIDVETELSGTINAPVGAVDMGWSSEITGTLNPTGSGIIEIDASSGGVHNFNAGSAATGDGTFQVSSGVTNFNDTHPIAPTFSFTNGTVNLFGTVNANGPFNWNAGTLANVGTLNANGTVNFGTASNRTMQGATLNIASSGTWADGGFAMDAGSVINLVSGNTLTVTDAGAASVFRSGVGAGETEPEFNISGTLVKSLTSTNVHNIDVATAILSTGVVNPLAGAFDFGWETSNSGLIQIGSSAEVDYDAGTHTNEVDGTIAGSGIHRVSNFITFNNFGTYAPGASAGTLTRVGNFDNGIFDVEIGGTTPGTGHDVLAVDGTATTDGTLNVSLIDGFAPGNGQSFVVLTSTDARSGTFQTVNAPGFDVVYNANDVTLVANVQELADLGLTKTASASDVNVGQNVTFTVTLSNGGPNTATSITVNDLLPTGLTFVSATPSTGSYDQGTGNWTLGTLANGGSATLEIVATVATAGAKTNTASVTSLGQTDNNGANDSASATVTGTQVDIAISKTVDNANANVGQTVNFTVTATNNGPSAATGIVVTDQLPAGLTYISDTPSQGSYVSGTGVWTVGDVANGANATLQIEATVAQAGTLTNTATLTSVDQPQSNTNNDSGLASVSGTQVDIALAKSASAGEVNLGSNVTFTVTATNNGPAAATGVQLTDLLPAGLTYVSDTPSQGTYVSGTGIWTVGGLANGANATLQLVATVDQAGALVNTAAVTAVDQPDTDDTNDTASATVTGLLVDIEVSKTVDNATPDLNANVTFTLTATNSGPSAATGVEITDLLPAGLTYVSDNPSQGAYVSGTGVWTVGGLANGASATLEIVATVAQTGSITNTATATVVDQPDSDDTNDSGSAGVSAVAVDIAVNKTVDNTSPQVSENVTFTVTATNSGPSGATGVQVTDLLPAGLTYVSDTPSQGAYVSGTGVWTVGDIASAASATLEITATVTQSGSITNTASVTAVDQVDSNASNDTDSQTIAGTQADIALTKTASASEVNVGSNVTFTVTATNNGPSAATGIVVGDALPGGLTYVSDTPSQGSYVSGTGVWTVGGLANGASATLEIVATVTSTATVTNTASVTASDQADPNGDNDTASAQVTGLQVDIAVTKTVDNASPDLNDQVTFTVTATNNGPSGATGIEVTDLLPAGLTYVSDNPSQGDYTAGTGLWAVGSLANSASATLEIVATVTQTGSITNTASVTSVDQPDSDGANDTGSQTIAGTLADLALTKTASASEVNVGSTVTFTVTVTNDGPNDATGVEVTDQLPAGLAYDSHSASQGTYTAATGLWAVGGLANGASATLEITAAVGSTETLTNTASVTAADQADPDVENNLSAAQVTGLQVDIGLAKTVDNASPPLNSNVVFTVTATNNGPSGATGVEVTDLLPAGLTYVSDTPSQGTYVSGTGVWAVGSLANGASATLAVTATVASEGSTTNTAAVTAVDQPDPLGANDTASQTVTTPMGGTLEGTVLDVAFDESSGKSGALAGLVETPLEGADVELLLDGSQVASTTTASDGTFSFDLSGKTAGLAYELRFLASGTVPETGSALDVRKTVAGVMEGSFTYRLPLTLAIQKAGLVFALQNLEIPASLLLGSSPAPVPLATAYDESDTQALLDTWLADVGVNREQIVESMARLLLAEIVLSELYDNAVWMSHETATTMFSLLRGYLVTQGVALEIQEGFRNRIISRLGQRVAQRHIAAMNRYITRLFVDEPSKILLASLPADCEPLIRETIEAMLAAAAGEDLIAGLGDTALYNRLITAGDQVLAGWYVEGTQPDLDASTTWAETFDYTGTSSEAYTAVQSVLGASDAATSAVGAQATDLRSQSNIEEVITRVLTHYDRTPNLGNLVSMYRQLKRARFAVLAQSIVATTTQLKQIEASDAPAGTDQAFHPSSPLQIQTAPSVVIDETQAAPSAVMADLAASSDAYRQALDDVVAAFSEGRRSDAIAQYGTLLDLDAQLTSDLFAAQAPIVAAAQNASAQVTGFDAEFNALTDAVAGAGIERSIFYAHLLQIVDDEQYPVDSLATQVDSVKTLLTEAETGITSATALVQGVQTRPYVAVSNLVQDRDAVAFDDTLRISATVKNLGTATANDVVVSLTTDAAGVIVSQASYAAGTLAADQEQTFEFAIKVVDPAVTVHSYRVNLTSSDALVVPASGSYNVSDFTAIEELAGEIPTSYRLGQSFPNPFNPQTTITFSVPAAGEVSLEVFDILGRRITTLVDEAVAAGTFQAVFNAEDLPSGTYFYRMHAGDFTEVRSMILVK